ncbi:MAG: DUF3494 domain-containing protein [Actinomycetia bacterium]|nr:DUF3494 domain-containing protein [Actinomycetes bacterium]
MKHWFVTGLFAFTGAAVLTGVTATSVQGSAAPPAPRSSVSATAPIALGVAGTYSLLSANYIVNTPNAPEAPHTIVRGNVGVSTLGRISGFPPGEITGAVHYSDSHSTAAQRALSTAYADAASRTPSATLEGDVSGRTLPPGVYHSANGLANAGVLLLDGGGDPNAVFILQAGPSLTFDAFSEVRLLNGAQVAGVFWQVTGSVTIGAHATVIGTIMSQGSISIGEGTGVDGRALSRAGGISTNNNFVDITRPIEKTRFTGIDPVRVADTRFTPDWFFPQVSGKVLRVRVANTTGVPANVSAAALNVTAVEPAAAGFLTVYPCTAAAPNVSTVNFGVGQTVANSTIATLATDGYVCVYASVAVNVIIDVNGWFSPAGDASMTPAVPHRVADTRLGIGGSTRLSAGDVLTVETGEPNASAVALNVTASGASAAGYLTVFPCGPLPNASTVNFAEGEARPNNAIAATGAGGVVCVFASAEVDVIVDVTSVFLPDGQLDYLPAAPIRLLDTRPHNITEAGSQVEFDVPSAGVPTLAVSVNVTAVADSSGGFSTAFQCGEALPNVSTVNQRVGEANANGAIVGVGEELAGCLYTLEATNFIVDLNGWWVVSDR